MAKMIDVAKSAGVSIKTVSRVLNNEPHVREAIRQKVLVAVKELNYIPSASARHLRSKRTYTIHIISHTINSNFLNAIQSGALLTSQKKGYRLILSLLEIKHLEDKEYVINWCKSLTQKNRPDGVILVPPYSNNETINDALLNAKIPIVRIGPNSIEDDNITILIEDKYAAKDAVNHLIQGGHKRIAIVKGQEDQQATHERLKGYKAALTNANIPIDDSLIFAGAFNFSSGMEAGDKILDMANPPTAVFAANDDMAAGILVSALKRDVRVPENLSIVGFDDSELAEKIWPQLTTVRQPFVKFGERAVEILIDIAGNKNLKPENTDKIRRLDYDIIIRNSTSPLL